MLERTIKESWTLEDVSELKSKLTKLNNRSKGLQKFHDQCQIVSYLSLGLSIIDDFCVPGSR